MIKTNSDTPKGEITMKFENFLGVLFEIFKTAKEDLKIVKKRK